MKSVEEQFEYLKKGCVDIIQEDELKTKLARSIKKNKPLKVKAGFDPTAPDIHLGHIVLLRKMKHFQDLGHDVIFLIGDFTGLIGDPSGRSATRPPMTREEINKNAETYKKQIFKILDPVKTIIDFNSRWLEKLTSFDMINLSSKYTVARLLERDDFSNRLKNNKPISVHEIFYPLMQAYDSVALKADVELGGTDQKFNLLVGREIQREFRQEPQVIMTTPLLEGLDGVEKMSKSLNNYVGITEPPSEIYGKIMSISDPLMYRYFELLTDESLSQIGKWKKEVKEEKINPRDLKSKLSMSITSDFWGKEKAKAAAEEFERVFKEKELPAEIEEIEIKVKEKVKLKAEAKAPKVEAREKSISLMDLLIERNIFLSRKEAKRVIRQGGVSLDNQRVEDVAFKIDLSKKGDLILKIGKRKFYRIVKKKA
ncbi:MAG: tyrosine--tRNA ligase [Candidatus Aminicenantes bacterium]|nr:tyrosine--tRNA ligase [Candidatus Aminicenantes bacterium]